MNGDAPAFAYAVAGARAADQAAIAAGTTGYALMQAAGRAAFDALRARWPTAHGLGIVCGTGNNGGDGFVVGTLARAAGCAVDLVVIGDESRIGGDAARALAAARAAGLVPRAWAGRLPAGEILVDALFGTGLTRAPAGDAADAVVAMNADARPVLAVDVPSGLDASTGHAPGAAVAAALTVTFIVLKTGLLTGAGPALCGQLRFAPLDVEGRCLDAVPPCARYLDGARAAHHFQPRARTAHKGDFGHVLVIGGAPGYAGAARLAAEAAARVGAGLVSLATDPGHAGAVTLARPEIMCRGVRGAGDLAPLLARASVVAIGPGLGQEHWASELLEAAVHAGLPLVVDADALNLLARQPRPLGCAVLTPHPGEAARLLDCTPADIARDRLAAARALAARHRAVVVLKGAGSVVQAPDGLPWIIGGGNPGMASGGMGDVLTGVVAGLIAQGEEAAEAAALAAAIHAAAADRAAVDGERGLLASDLMPHLRRLVNGGTS